MKKTRQKVNAFHRPTPIVRIRDRICSGAIFTGLRRRRLFKKETHHSAAQDDGFITINAKIASILMNAGQPSQNQQRMVRR